MNIHEYYMQQAIMQAKRAWQINEVPIGAVIVKDGQIIGRGYNRRETDRNPLGHAEIMAVQEAAQHVGGWRLEGSDMYVTLEPCPMCAGAIVQSRISRLIFGAYDPKSGYAGSLYNTLQDSRLNHQTEVVSGVCAEVCQSLLKSFFRQLRQGRKK